MKKLSFFVLLLFAVSSYAQESTDQEQDKHEVTLNGLTLVALEWLDINYHYLINDESSFGVNVQFGFDPDASIDSFRKFSITPNYRQYFSKKYAQGFYVEGFASLINYETEVYNYDLSGPSTFTEENLVDFGLGISIGGKLVSKRGFIADVHFGVGRYLGDRADLEAFIRGGISLGYRF